MLLLALGLVTLNGFFVLSEFALVKVRRTRLQELADNGKKSAQVALEVSGHIDTYLTACQLGITLSSLGLGWLGEPAIARLISPVFIKVAGWSPVYTHTIAGIIAFILIALLHIVVGELVPKSIAIQKTESSALLTAGPLKAFYRLFYPIIWLFNGTALLFLKAIKIEPANEASLAHTEEELRMLVSASQEEGYLDIVEGDLLNKVFTFSDRIAREVMVPRQDIVCLFTDDTYEDVLDMVKQHGHTRYPLCEGDKDHVIGFIHVRDILKLTIDSPPYDIINIKRDIMIVPENMLIAEVMQRMRQSRTHIAIVADEFGGTAGLLTMEDILEELVGEIYDEFDINPPEITKTDDDQYEISGRVLLEELEEFLDIDFDENDEVDTIGGLIFSILGRKPEIGDSLELGRYRFEISDVDGMRILKVKVFDIGSSINPVVEDVEVK